MTKTINEKRAEIGLEPVPWGKDPIATSNLAHWDTPLPPRKESAEARILVEGMIAELEADLPTPEEIPALPPEKIKWADYTNGTVPRSTVPTTLYPLGDGIGSVSLVQHVGDDKMVVNAARVSFGGDSDAPLTAKDEKLIKYLLQNHHGSPFEHNLITFKVVCPIFVDRQMVRHRVGTSKNEISGRYVEVKDQMYVPQSPRRQAKSNRQASVADTDETGQLAKFGSLVYRTSCEASLAAYHELLAMGMTREQARGVLPQTMYTESYYTFNLRSLFHFLGLRDHEGAQYETQLYAKALRELAAPLFPVSFAAWDSLSH
jgi:thymidylate synthase (FAD)